MLSGRPQATMSSKEKTAKDRDGERKPKDDVDELALKVDATLRSSGADEYGINRNSEVAPTMKALLNQYTQYSALTEVDENGEHPLFPQSQDSARREVRNRNLRQTVGSGAALGSSKGASQSSGRNMLDMLFRRMDTDRWPQIKDCFYAKEDSLTSAEFVSMLRSHIGHIPGGDERLVTAELAKLHTRLYKGTSLLADDEVDAADIEGVEGQDGEGEPAEVPVVSWSMFARLLLETGIVGDMVRSFDIVKVLNHIDLDRIAPLKDEFMSLGNALELEHFVAIMKRQFHYIFELVNLFDLKKEQRQLIAQLVDLFEIIDINGNNIMSWGEFTAFLVDQGMSEDVPRGFNIIRFGDSAVVDETMHQSHCEKAIYLKHYDKIAYVEQGSRSLKLCSPDLVPYFELKDFAQMPLYAAYIENESFLVVSCSDLTLSFYDVNNGLKLVRRILSQTAQLVLCWSSSAHVLYSADHEGSIFAWDIAAVKAGIGRSHYEPGQGDPSKDFLKLGGDRQKADDRPRGDYDRMPPWARHVQQDKHPAKGEITKSSVTPRGGGYNSARSAKAKVVSVASELGKSIVMALLELEVLGLLASCGIDGKVMLWDIFTGKAKTTLKGHDMGVRCMAFAAASKVLVTGGYDYNLMVWNPYVGTSIHIMKGHIAQIVGVEVLGNASNQVVSADSEGSVKTWDLGTYQCLQTIVVSGVLKLRAFLSIPGYKRILCVDRKFVAHDYLNTGVADQTDEHPIIKSIYIPRLKVFISGCTSHLRIWDAVTGAIKCVIEHPESEITDFCVDDRGRKVFIANHDGEIKVYNSTTGCEIKKLTKHEQEISGMIYCRGDKNLMTVSWDHSIMVHDESEKSAKVLRVATHIHAGDIMCVAFSRHLGLIATGATDCVISLREYTRLRSISFLLGHKADITALAFVDPLPLLVSADSNGNVAVWAVPQPTGQNHKFVNEALTRFINMQSLESSASVNCFEPLYIEAEQDAAPVSPLNTFMTGIAATAAAHGQFLLYSGDEDGDARVWDLTRLLEVADVMPCAPKPDWDPRKGDQLDCSHTTETMARRARSVEQPELPIRINEPVVRQANSWRAHGDSIRSIKVYRSPDCVLTAGYDQMVKIWTLDGQLMTVLRAYGAIPWNFPVRADMLGIDDDTLDGIIERVKEAEKQALKRPSKHRMSQPVMQLAAEVQGFKSKTPSYLEAGGRRP